jgi:purine-binding chemotaxis protein CheW
MTDAAHHYILFVVAGTTYALPSRDVAHVEMVEQVTAVPNAAPFVDGVVFSRGQVVPAINMRARFGFQRAATDLRTRLLVVQAGSRTVGLLVDACREFLTIPPATIHPPGDALVGIGIEYIDGIATVGERMIVILALDALLNASGPAIPGPDKVTGELHGNP